MAAIRPPFTESGGQAQAFFGKASGPSVGRKDCAANSVGIVLYQFRYILFTDGKIEWFP